MENAQIKRYLVPRGLPLKEAMRRLSSISGKVIFVVDRQERLIGSLTDGDIRRAILKGNTFDSPVWRIMFAAPRFLQRKDPQLSEHAKRFVLQEKIYVIPVLDERRRIVDILFWNDLFDMHPHEAAVPEKLANPVVIMAGGKGERLDPFTRILPKPLIPVGDQTILERIMENFNRFGFGTFLLTVNYKKEIIRTYLKENRFPFTVECIEEKEGFLGTAGSLALLKKKLKETFFVSNCDVIIENDLKGIMRWHQAEKALVTVIGCHREMVVPYGSLAVKGGRLKAIDEKPTFDMIINTGVYVMEPQVLEHLRANERIDMNHFLERLLKHGKISVYTLCDGWFDIGQWKEYHDSLFLLQNSHVKTPKPLTQ